MNLNGTISFSLALAIAATPAAAQLCSGLPSLDEHRGHVAGRVGLGDDATELGASFTWGGLLYVAGEPIPAGRAQFVPTASLQLAHIWREGIVDLGDEELRGEYEDLHGLLEAGCGLLFARNLGARAMLEVPVGIDGVDSRFVLTFAIGVGRRQ